jgi:hypothetical protein
MEPTEAAVGELNGLRGDECNWRVPIHHALFVLPSDPLPTKVNLCDVIDETTLLRGITHRFCSKAFSLTDEGKKSLQTSLANAARESGGLSLIVVSGAGKKQRSGARVCFTLACDCSVSYESTSDAKNDKENRTVKQGNYKQYDSHNDGCIKRAASNGGTDDTHQTTTMKVLNRETKAVCRFRLPVYVDCSSYFLRSGTGCSVHSHRTKISPRIAAPMKPTIHRTEEEKRPVAVTKKAHSNYPPDTCHLVGDSLQSPGVPAGLSKELVDFGNVDYGDDIDDMIEETAASLEPARNPWEEWYPKFKFIVDMATANCNAEVLAEGNAALDDMMTRIDKLLTGATSSSKRSRVSVYTAQST